MKLLQFAIISLLAVFSASCNKDDDSSPSPNPPATQIEGVYKGKYGFDNETPDANYTLKFQANGRIQELGQASGNPIGEGTYNLKGTHISAKYTMLVTPFHDYYIEAVYDPTTETISGTWGYEPGGTDGGLFSLKK